MKDKENRELRAKLTCNEEKREKKLTVPLDAAVRRTSVLTGVSESTVSRIGNESKTTGNNLSRKTRSDKHILDDFDLAVVRRTVSEMIGSRKAVPTVKRLLAALKDKLDYRGGEQHLRRTLKEIGFSWKRVESNRKLLMERNDIIFQRAQYLRKMKQFREQGRTIIYTDETFVHAGHAASKCWQSDDIVLSVPFNKGNRLIVVHAGSENGFVNGAGLVFKSKTKSGDYHDDMNFENFHKWLRTQLLPNIPANSVIVIDNAPYHSVQTDRCPSSNARKDVIKDWLQRHNIAFDNSMLKVELLQLCKMHKPQPKYVIDSVLRSHGHECIRLPPYHADLNAIEFIWANLKRKVSSRNLKFNLTEVAAHVEEGFVEITATEWKACCDHVRRVEEQYWQQDIAKEEEMERLVIFVESGSDCDTDTASEGENSETDTADETS